MKARIVILPGDGIGPEVTAAALNVLDAVASLAGHHWITSIHTIGGDSVDACGVPLSDKVLTECRSADAVLLGAVGGPRWEHLEPALRPEQGLLALRRGLNVFANLRPIHVFPALANCSPVRSEHLQGVDLLVVRELTGGLYFSQPRLRQTVDGRIRAVDTLEYYDDEIFRVARLAFELASARRGKVTSVDKANVLESSRLWRQVVEEVATSFPGISLEHMLVDTAAMRLISQPSGFDVLLTENMFGDILTDEAAVLCGSMGMVPSASLGFDGPGLYEPIHGSAPDIAGKGIANPLGAILSAAMLLRHSLHLEDEARRVEHAVESALQAGCRSADLGGKFSTAQMAEEIIRRL